MEPPEVSGRVVEDPDPADVFALLDDTYACGILTATNRTPMSARQLATELDASRSTVYRRIEQLEALGLLVESTEIDADGHHRGYYEARLDRITVDLHADGFSVAVDRSEHPADRFTDVWEGL
jgi:biotin operon repressor